MKFIRALLPEPMAITEKFKGGAEVSAFSLGGRTLSGADTEEIQLLKETV